MARAKDIPKREMLPRTVKWEIIVRGRPELEKLLLRTSDGLREYEHWALAAEGENYASYKALQQAAGGAKPNAKSFLSDFDLYTRYMPLRQADEAAGSVRATVPANWVLESCFRKVSAAYKSWFTLLKRGDSDARSIQPSDEWKFMAIQGALSPSSMRRADGRMLLVLAPRIFPGMFEFEVPKEYQAPLLANAKRPAKFVISRRKSDLRQPGRYWVSVTYEIEKSETKPFIPEEATYVALGASSISVLWDRNIPTYDPAAYWKPKIEDVERRMRVHPWGSQKRLLLRATAKKMRCAYANDRLQDWRRGARVIQLARPDKVLKPCIEGIDAKILEVKEHPLRPDHVEESLRKLRAARDRRFAVMAANQTLDRRQEVADLLRKLGPHFVVIEYDIRSKKGKLADAEKPERTGSLGLNWMAQNTGSIGYLGQWLEIKVAEFGGAVHWHRLPPEAVPKGLPRGHENKVLMVQALRVDFLKTFSPEATA